MSFLENIRKAPKEKKIRAIWIIVLVAVVVMVIIWILTARTQKDVARDTSLFQTIGRGFNNLKSNYNQPIK